MNAKYDTQPCGCVEYQIDGLTFVEHCRWCEKHRQPGPNDGGTNMLTKEDIRRMDQDIIRLVFGGLSAKEAAKLILGLSCPTNEMVDALTWASGNGDPSLAFLPEPVGHIGFELVNGRLKLAPATKECKKQIAKLHKEEWCSYADRECGLPYDEAAELWEECGGDEHAFYAAISRRTAYATGSVSSA